jgi:hypothetical protein
MKEFEDDRVHDYLDYVDYEYEYIRAKIEWNINHNHKVSAKYLNIVGLEFVEMRVYLQYTVLAYTVDLINDYDLTPEQQIKTYIENLWAQNDFENDHFMLNNEWVEYEFC